MSRLKGRLAERGMSIRLSEQAESHLASEGYDPVYGARPLKRAIQQRVANPPGGKILAAELVAGEEGGSGGGRAGRAGSGAGVLIDASGNGHDGTPLGGPVYQASPAGLCLRFDGVNDRVFVPDSAAFEFQSLTVEAYVLVEAYP